MDLSTVTPYGELSRMTQFKEKSEREPENINAGLMSYPILMAADILLYRATRVPVGADQVQHLELAREICRRFNARFGEVFPEPQPLHTKALKILGLDGKQKMSKSLGNSVQVSDEPDEIRKKIKNAFTDPTRLQEGGSRAIPRPATCARCRATSRRPRRSRSITTTAATPRGAASTPSARSPRT